MCVRMCGGQDGVEVPVGAVLRYRDHHLEVLPHAVPWVAASAQFEALLIHVCMAQGRE